MTNEFDGMSDDDLQERLSTLRAEVERRDRVRDGVVLKEIERLTRMHLLDGGSTEQVQEAVQDGESPEQSVESAQLPLGGM